MGDTQIESLLWEWGHVKFGGMFVWPSRRGVRIGGSLSELRVGRGTEGRGNGRASGWKGWFRLIESFGNKIQRCMVFSCN